MKLTHINIFPIKSLRGIPLQESIIEPRGLQFDRRWMLVDSNGQFLTQRRLPKMTFLQPEIHEDHLKVYHINNPQTFITIPFDLGNQPLRAKVSVWNDELEAVVLSTSINQWFSEILGIECRLVVMDEQSSRFIDPDYQIHNEIVSLADGYPILIIGEASMNDLNNRLSEPMDIIRFRPNFVFSGGQAFEEDTWKLFKVGNHVFRGTKPCARCAVPTIDPDTGLKGKEPMATLTTFRMDNKKILFGMNVVPLIQSTVAESVIKIGDKIALL